MELIIEIYANEDCKDIVTDFEKGKIYYVTLSTDNMRIFNFHLNYFIERAKAGVYRIIAPYRYLPEHEAINCDVFEFIKPLTEYCREYYQKLETR
jgi:hypothetical protein